MRRILVLLTLLGTAALGAAQEPSAEVLNQISRATVRIQVQRVGVSRVFNASATGFFVHRDGYLLTAAQVVADDVGFDLAGSGQRMATKASEIMVVIESGSPRESQVPATIVALDNTRGLALLKVRKRPQVWLECNHDKALAAPASVLIGGFFVEENLSFGDQNVSIHPSIEIGSRGVAAGMRDSDGDLVRLKVDAAIHAGGSGAPVLDNSGLVVGVILGKGAPARSLNTLVAPLPLAEFLLRNAYKVTLQPPMISPSLSRLVVRITPQLEDLASTQGIVTLVGDDLEPVDALLNVSGPSAQAVLQLAARIPGTTVPERYRADLLITDQEGTPLARRRIGIRSTAAGTRHGSTTTVGPAEDRVSTLIGDGRTISSPTSPGTTGGMNTVAEGLQFGPRDDKGLVVDDDDVRRMGETGLTSARYEDLPPGKARTLATKYDALQATYASLVSTGVSYSRTLSDLSWDERRRLYVIRNECWIAARNVHIAAIELKKADICNCGSSNVWYEKSNAPCTRCKVNNSTVDRFGKSPCYFHYYY